MPLSAMSAKRYASLREFYPFYLAQHSLARNRRLHFLGIAADYIVPMPPSLAILIVDDEANIRKTLSNLGPGKGRPKWQASSTMDSDPGILNGYFIPYGSGCGSPPIYPGNYGNLTVSD